MQIKEFLKSICEQIKYTPIREEISKEICGHIEDVKEVYVNEGMSELEAENKAIEQMGDAEDIGRRLNKIHRPRFDWKLVLIIAVLLIGGGLIAYIRQNSSIRNQVGFYSIRNFIAFVILGIVLGTIIYFFDYRIISKYSGVIYVVAICVFVFSIIPNIGVSLNGRPYFRIPIFNINVAPSVIMVPLYVIAIVGFISNINKKDFIQRKFQVENINFANKCKILILGVFSIITLLIVNSFTSAVILGFVYLIITTVVILNPKSLSCSKDIMDGEKKVNAKISKRKIMKVALIWGILLLAIVFPLTPFGNFSSFRLDRIKYMFNPEADPNGSGYLGMQQRTIIRSSNAFGPSDDMSWAIDIFDEGTNFAVISILAHYGWVVSGVVIIAVVFMSIKLLINSVKIKEIFGKLLTIGIASVFILQSVCNLLMNFNMGVIADFNIPLVSYGGANLVINMVCLGLVLSVYRRKDII